MDQRIINLFDEYTHRPLTREEFIKKLARLTGSVASAMAVLPLLEVNYAVAAPIQDDSVSSEYITYPGDGITMMGYLAKPKKNGKYPGVLVIHENRGLNPYIEEVTRKVAKEGFIALAPDALSPAGTPADSDIAREQISKLDSTVNENNFKRGFEYLKSKNDCTGKIGCVGFCWGGALVNQLAVDVPDLNAAVAFYGRQPDSNSVSRIKAALQLHYGGLDERVNAGIPAYEEALKKADVHYQLFVYEGAQHAFHNNMAPTRYNEAAANLAWSRTITFFNEKLK
jgi:carboxymethylenebutenolidase